jgi:hypothetical protein
MAGHRTGRLDFLMDDFEALSYEDDLQKAREIKEGARRQLAEATALEAEIEGKLVELRGGSVEPPEE